MQGVIQVAKDRDGVQAAALEMMVESLSKTPPKRKLSDGYYKMAEYLFWLEGTKEITQVAFTADEVNGLSALAQARQEFRATHPGCPRCGAANHFASFSCRKCRHELQGKKK
jgi:hypothetical protein